MLYNRLCATSSAGACNIYVRYLGKFLKKLKITSYFVNLEGINLKK